jgi:hypothetical protein
VVGGAVDDIEDADTIVFVTAGEELVLNAVAVDGAVVASGVVLAGGTPGVTMDQLVSEREIQRVVIGSLTCCYVC